MYLSSNLAVMFSMSFKPFDVFLFLPRSCPLSTGNVYHLYTQHLYSLFDDFELSEVKRQPMTEVALRLKSMLRGGGGGSSSSTSDNMSGISGGNSGCDSFADVQSHVVTTVEAGDAQRSTVDNTSDPSPTSITVPITSTSTSAAAPTSTIATSTTAPPSTPSLLLPSVTSVLLSLIEPPSLQSIHAALHTLYSYGMLTSSAEDSRLTEIGTLAADLPVDFMLGRFIGYAGNCLFVFLFSLSIHQHHQQ